MNEHEEQGRKLDEMLDAALAEYGAVEPLHGLEERVLGRLRGAEARRPWWIWGAAVAGAALLAGLWLARPQERPRPAVANAPQTAAPVAPAQQVAPPAPVPHAAAGVRVARATQPGSPALPKREVFPSPTPPTAEELLWARYMQVTPREEVLAQINRPPLEFHEDLQAAPGTSPQKSEGTK